jgi:hypothetical protein
MIGRIFGLSKAAIESVPKWAVMRSSHGPHFSRVDGASFP